MPMRTHVVINESSRYPVLVETPLIVALVALAGTFVTAGIAAYNARRLQIHTTKIQEIQAHNERIITSVKASFELRLTEIKNEMAQQNAALNARRDYEYEARKRLYKESEPLLFQLAEAAENALYRIYSLARTARSGHLDPTLADGWLHRPNNYYSLSTAYYLLAPLAHARLLQQTLTGVDLELDQTIHLKYILAKRILLSFTDDFTFAKVTPTVEYNPEAEGERKEGIYLGLLDHVLSALLTPNRQVMSYGEFEKAVLRGEDFGIVVEPFFELLIDFHPEQQPIFWRILLAQAHIYLAFSRGLQPGHIEPFQLTRLTQEERQWLASRDAMTANDDVAVDAAWDYLTQNLPSALFPVTAS